MGSPAEQQAMQFAVEKFLAHGCDTAYIMPMTRTSRVNTTSGIAVGIKRGTTNRTIVLGGHIDSAEPEIPGANDDGSGTAVVLELSRVLCAEAHQSTIVFCCFGGEEQGLEGSRYFVNHFPEIENVVLMLQADMANGLGIIDLLLQSGETAAPQWLVRATVEEFYMLGYSNLRYATFFMSLNSAFGSGVGSDHEPFLAAGIPALDLTTEPGDPIHTPRDNFENFEQPGLERTGDVILRLVHRFDAGVPAPATEQYFLILLGQTPLFFPGWSLWSVVVFSALLALVAIIIVRRQRELPRTSGRGTWLKITFFTCIIVCVAWFSSNIVGLLKGVRHPWLANPDGFYLLAGIGMITGIVISMWLSKMLPITTCPYRLFRSSAALLGLMLILSSTISANIALAPASALVFISLAMLVKQPALKIFFVLVSPFWMMRFLFSEWKELIFRASSLALPTDFLVVLIINGAIVLVLTIYALPFAFAAAAVLRTIPVFSSRLTFLKSRWALACTSFLFIVSTVALTNVPSYNTLWYRDIHATIKSEMNTRQTTFTIKSSEYLDGVLVSYDKKETGLKGRTTTTSLPVPSTFDSSLVTITHNEQKTEDGNVNVDLRLTTKIRPYKIIIKYSSAIKGQIPALNSPFVTITKEDARQIEWYSFPDTALVIPIQLTIPPNNTLKETITVTFSELPAGTTIEGELCYVIPRMEYVMERKYHR